MGHRRRHRPGISLAEYAGAILTSAQKVIDVAVLDVINKNFGGDTGGENYIGTLANKGVALSPFHDFDSQISAELKAELEALRPTSPMAPSRSAASSE